MPYPRLSQVLRAILMFASSMGIHGAHAAQAQPPEVAIPAAAKGSLVIIGGNLMPDNVEVWQRIVALAGGNGARIAVFPSASAYPAQTGERIVERLTHYGADAFLVPLAVKLEGSDFRKVAEDGDLAASVRAAGGVFFAGGDQARITQALVREDGSRSAMLDAVWDVYRRGGVVAGSSAGAAIMSSTMFYAPNTVFATLRSGVSDGKEIAPGLGFIGDDVFVDQHLLVRGRFARMIPAMLKKGYKIGLGIDENTAMVVDPSRRVEILGARGAMLIDLTRATTQDGSVGFNVSNAVISYLDRGDQYDLATRTFIPSREKANGKLDGYRPDVYHPVFSPDILGKNAVVDLMEKLMNNRRKEGVGIAVGGPGDLQPELAFQFTFSKTADSVGYASASAPSYSILNMRLDIQPIELGPVLQPK
jgi:cyanophycinase